MSRNEMKDRLRPEGKTSLADVNQLYRQVQVIDSLGEHALINLFECLITTLVTLAKKQEGNRTVLQTEVAFMTLLVLGSVHSCARTSPLLRSLVSSNADLLMTWIRYFYQRKDGQLIGRGSIIRSLADKGMKQLLIDTLSSALYTMYRIRSVHEGYLPHIQASLGIIAGLWLSKDTTKGDGRLPLLLFEQLIQKPTRDQMTRALIDSANGDSDRVASKAITRLRRAMKMAPGNLRQMCHHLKCTMELAVNRDHAISDSLHEHQIFTTFSKCVRLLVTNWQNGASSLEENCCLEYYLHSLMIMILKGVKSGERALRQCIRYGMLDGIAQLLMDESYEEALEMENTSDVLSLLVTGLNIESVCIEMSNAFKRLPLSILTMDTISGSAMRDNWKRFVNVVMVRSIFVKFRTLARACDKAGGLCFYCKRRFPKHSLQICGTCNFTKFCSVACQTDDQTARYHKVICDFIVTQHKSHDAIPLASADRNVSQFAKCVAFYDVRRHRAHLRRLAMLQYPKVDPKFIGIRLDYHRGFPTFDFFLLPTPILEPYHRLMTAFSMRFLAPKRTERRKEATIVLISYPYELGRDSKEKQETKFFETHDEGLGDGPQNPRLRPGTKEGEKRACGRFVHGDIPLEPCYDEVDEIMRRMSEETKKFPDLMRDPLSLVDRVFNDLDKDWPFESPFQLQNTSFHSD